MNMVTALAIVVGMLLAVWLKVSVLIGGLYWFVGAVGWALYMAAGGSTNGLKKAIAAGLLGMALVAGAEMIALFSQHLEWEWLLVGASMSVAVLLSRISIFSFIPAALCGASIIGGGGPVGIFDAITNSKLAISYVAGTVLGFVADAVAKMLTKKAA